MLQNWSFRCFFRCLSLAVAAYMCNAPHMVVLWLLYVYESRNLSNSLLQYKLKKKYKELKSSENQCARKKVFSMIHEN